MEWHVSRFIDVTEKLKLFMDHNVTQTTRFKRSSCILIEITLAYLIVTQPARNMAPRVWHIPLDFELGKRLFNNTNKPDKCEL